MHSMMNDSRRGMAGSTRRCMRMGCALRVSTQTTAWWATCGWWLWSMRPIPPASCSGWWISWGLWLPRPLRLFIEISCDLLDNIHQKSVPTFISVIHDCHWSTISSFQHTHIDTVTISTHIATHRTPRTTLRKCTSDAHAASWKWWSWNFYEIFDRYRNICRTYTSGMWTVILALSMSRYHFADWTVYEMRMRAHGWFGSCFLQHRMSFTCVTTLKHSHVPLQSS